MLMTDQGEILSTAATKLTELYHQYGELVLSKALKKALELKIGRYAYVARICHQMDKSKSERPPLPIDLSSHPELQSIDVKQHDLNIYDPI